MNKAPKVSHVIVQFVLVVACLAFASSAKASGFAGPFSVEDFTVFQTDPNDLSFVCNTSNVCPDGGPVVITGGNKGTIEESEIDWILFAPFTGVATFDWSYSSLDDPGFDWGGFDVNGIHTILADTAGEAGSATVDFFAGESFGFFVHSVDNQFEPGVLTISNLQVTQTPEPGTVGLLFGAMLMVVGWHRWTTYKKKRV